MTEFLPEFTLLQPQTVEEAIAMHAAHAGGETGARFVAGGTDLLVNMRRGLGVPETLISLSRVEDFSNIAAQNNGEVAIGAGVTLARLIENEIVQTRYPALAHAAHEIAGPGHRETATVGGNLCLDTRCVFYNQSLWWRESNIYCLKYKGDTCHVAPKGTVCHAAFSGDMAPVLLVLGADIDVVGQNGTRRIAINDLYTGDGIDYLTLKEGEMVTAVHLAKDPRPHGLRKNARAGRHRFPLVWCCSFADQGRGQSD